MTIDTKSVAGRRQVTLHSFEEMFADAERLVASPNTKTLGNWPLGQLLTHLASSIHMSIDGLDLKAPWYFRWLGPFIKSRILKRGMPPGFSLPKDRVAGAFPAADSPQAALEMLRAAIARSRVEPMVAPHPFFGKMTHDDWTRMHMRHAEMHLSFADPGEAPSVAQPHAAAKATGAT